MEGHSYADFMEAPELVIVSIEPTTVDSTVVTDVSEEVHEAVPEDVPLPNPLLTTVDSLMSLVRGLDDTKSRLMECITSNTGERSRYFLDSLMLRHPQTRDLLNNVTRLGDELRDTVNKLCDEIKSSKARGTKLSPLMLEQLKQCLGDEKMDDNARNDLLGLIKSNPSAENGVAIVFGHFVDETGEVASEHDVVSDSFVDMKDTSTGEVVTLNDGSAYTGTNPHTDAQSENCHLPSVFSSKSNSCMSSDVNKAQTSESSVTGVFGNVNTERKPERVIRRGQIIPRMSADKTEIIYNFTKCENLHDEHNYNNYETTYVTIEGRPKNDTAHDNMNDDEHNYNYETTVEPIEGAAKTDTAHDNINDSINNNGDGNDLEFDENIDDEYLEDPNEITPNKNNETVVTVSDILQVKGGLTKTHAYLHFPIEKHNVPKNKHKAYLDKEVQCPHCGVILRKALMPRHMSTHVKRYKCDLCPKMFYFKSEIARHRNAHTKDKTYPCKQCDMVYKAPSSLQAHVKNHHQNDRAFVCCTCGIQFNDRYRMENHIKTVHEQYRPFVCKVCKKACSTRTNLKYHMKVHVK